MFLERERERGEGTVDTISVKTLLPKSSRNMKKPQGSESPKFHIQPKDI